MNQTNLRISNTPLDSHVFVDIKDYKKNTTLHQGRSNDNNNSSSSFLNIPFKTLSNAARPNIYNSKPPAWAADYNLLFGEGAIEAMRNAMGKPVSSGDNYIYYVCVYM